MKVLFPELYIKEPLSIKCICPICNQEVTARKCYPDEEIPFDNFTMDIHCNPKDDCICAGSCEEVPHGTHPNEELATRMVAIQID
jgi:hypothetical protein